MFRKVFLEEAAFKLSSERGGVSEARKGEHSRQRAMYQRVPRQKEASMHLKDGQCGY